MNTTEQMNPTKTIDVIDYQRALKATLEYFAGDELAATTWLNKYAMRDENGSLLEMTPVDMHRRMAREFARKEREHKSAHGKFGLSEYGNKRMALNEETIFGFFDHFRYIIPQGSIMAALGNTHMV